MPDDLMETIPGGGDLVALLTSDWTLALFRALLILALGLLAARIAATAVARFVAVRATAQQTMLTRRVVFYGIALVAGASALHQLGFDLSVLLGAAGILTVAIGFASQTSASNLISGLFLLGERPFVVGDVIRVGTTTGEAVAVDLLSVKLRTFDNLFVRIPNETLLKTEITNLTRYPIRRIDMQLGVAYKEDLERVRGLVFELADRDPLVLDEPKPLFIFQGFGDSALQLQVSVWVKRQNFLEVRTNLQLAIKERFDSEGIEIPFPHRTLYPGSVAEPFPVRLVERAPDASDE